MFTAEAEKGNEKDKLMKKLHEELYNIDKYIVYLPEIYTKVKLNLKKLIESNEDTHNPLVGLIESQELSKTVQAFDQIRKSVSVIMFELNKYITDQKPQWARMQELYSTLNTSLEESLLTELPAKIRAALDNENSTH